MWEREELLKQGSKLDMTFASFFEIYEEDKKKRVKENTWESKSHVIRTKILPYFGQRKIGEIEAKEIIAWQNEMLEHKSDKGEKYSPTYLKTIHSQLSAIFNHEVWFYHLPFNPAQKAGTMGSINCQVKVSASDHIIMDTLFTLLGVIFNAIRFTSYGYNRGMMQNPVKDCIGHY